MSLMRHNYSLLGLLPRARSPQNFFHFELRRFPKQIPRLIPLFREKFASLLSNDETYLGTHQLGILQFQSSHKAIDRGVIQKSLLPVPFTPTESFSFSLRSVKIKIYRRFVTQNVTYRLPTVLCL